MTLDLGRFPRVKLAHLPTPLEELERLGREVGEPIWVKRDDCTGLAFGGNKTRKLEFTLGDALRKGANAIVTSGGLQSNHARQTAAAAARVGLPCHLVLANPLDDAPPGYERSGNRLIDDLLGATVHVVTEDEVDVRVQEIAESLVDAHGGPYVVPLGASDGIGALGYVECARELIEQRTAQGLETSHVFVATGSAGTQAGLLTGLRAMGSMLEVIGISVSEPAEVKRDKVYDIATQVSGLMSLGSDTVTGDDIVVLDDYVGPGYGATTPESSAAIRLLAQSEGLLLDPVYTGKAMAGMLDVLERGLLGRVRAPIFLHTGGAPALFAYPPDSSTRTSPTDARR